MGQITTRRAAVDWWIFLCWALVACGLGLPPVSSSHAGGPTPSSALDAPLAHAVAHIRAQTGPGERLAVHITPAGHWQLANDRGEMVTAAGAEEVQRALVTLAGQAAASPAASLSLVLTDEAAGRAGAGLSQLPTQAALTLLSGSATYRLQRVEKGSSITDRPSAPMLLAEVRPSLLIEVGDPATLREMLWQLERKLDPSAVRLLSLEPGGPRTLASVPKREPGGRTTLPDAVDPYGLVKALPALRGQKVLIVGRLDKDLLWYRPRSGADQSVLVKDVREAAAASDIALVLLDSRAARQPGERTWSYLKVNVPGFDEAMQGATFADFYNALAVAQGKLVMRLLERGADRVRIEAVPLKSTFGRLLGARTLEERGVGGALRDLVTGLTGSVVPAADLHDGI